MSNKVRTLPSYAVLEQRMESHEQNDNERHARVMQMAEATNENIEVLSDKVDTLVTSRAVESAQEKQARRWLMFLITLAGVVVPVLIAILDHWPRL
jgi:hypothetical protein